MPDSNSGLSRLDRVFESTTRHMAYRTNLVYEIAMDTAIVLDDYARRLLASEPDLPLIMSFDTLLSAIASCSTSESETKAQLDRWKMFYLTKQEHKQLVAADAYCCLLVELQRRSNVKSRTIDYSVTAITKNLAAFKRRSGFGQTPDGGADLYRNIYHLEDCKHVGLLRPFVPAYDCRAMSDTALGFQESYSGLGFVELHVAAANEPVEAGLAK